MLPYWVWNLRRLNILIYPNAQQINSLNFFFYLSSISFVKTCGLWISYHPSTRWASWLVVSARGSFRTGTCTDYSHNLAPHDDVMAWKCFPHYWPFVRETTVARWIPPTKVLMESFGSFLIVSMNRLFDSHYAGDMKHCDTHVTSP